MSMRRIGIMGGTFNPIHNGHLAIAAKAREQFALEKVLFMPSGVPYMKDQRKVLPIQARCEMTALAISDTPGFVLSEMEVEDAVQGKNTYTCDTLIKLRNTDPEAAYFFLVGADSLYAMEDWKSPELIFQSCTVLAAARTENASTQPQGPCERLNKQAQYLREKYHASIEILEFAGMDVSSTQIRERARAGKSLRGMVPETVETYIRRNHLYEKDS